MHIEPDRDLFVGNSQAYWDAIRTGSSEKANEIERTTKKLVDKWLAQKVAVEVLTAMLSNSAPEVRFFAAAYLVGLDESSKEHATTVLEDICRQDSGLMSVSAATILRVRGLRSAKISGG